MDTYMDLTKTIVRLLDTVYESTIDYKDENI